MTLEFSTAKCLVEQIAEFHQALRHVSMPDAGIAGRVAYRALLRALDSQGPLRAAELASQLCIGESVLSRQLAELVNRGLVLRSADPLDRRATQLSLSEQGRAELAAVEQRNSERLAEALADWDEAEAKQAIGLIERLSSKLAEFH
ncbi:MarR family winged helix-turn-helix transcriptional regulator [Psychromicrobium lacuslunae]|uniref:HTH marR-type domain-containing protein n=1 Tax=Psychromicrobium lacuslunae TaxID=1618207 RepID=A0A0D4C1Y2_9MICC|nr:MarR family transcriptional regulator [Psychromicrobium lacuslunae]AJT42682.1 hypothetical protein UM93_16575 [Psychromicrobium lacuslunae]